MCWFVHHVIESGKQTQVAIYSSLSLASELLDLDPHKEDLMQPATPKLGPNVQVLAAEEGNNEEKADFRSYFGAEPNQG